MEKEKAVEGIKSSQLRGYAKQEDPRTSGGARAAGGLLNIKDEETREGEDVVCGMHESRKSILGTRGPGNSR